MKQILLFCVSDSFVWLNCNLSKLFDFTFILISLQKNNYFLKE